MINRSSEFPELSLKACLKYSRSRLRNRFFPCAVRILKANARNRHEIFISDPCGSGYLLILPDHSGSSAAVAFCFDCPGLLFLLATIFPSRIRTVSIPDPRSSSKNLSNLTPKKQKKWFLSSKKYDPGCSSRIRMLTFSHPGSRGQKGTQSRIRNTVDNPQHPMDFTQYSLLINIRA
jgi:hypothetical protein